MQCNVKRDDAAKQIGAEQEAVARPRYFAGKRKKKAVDHSVQMINGSRIFY
jgi:hypothetical protein